MTLEEAKDYLEDIMEEDLQQCTAYQRIGIYLNLMEFFKPKKQRTSILGNENELPQDFHETNESI